MTLSLRAVVPVTSSRLVSSLSLSLCICFTAPTSAGEPLNIKRAQLVVRTFKITALPKKKKFRRIFFYQCVQISSEPQLVLFCKTVNFEQKNWGRYLYVRTTAPHSFSQVSHVMSWQLTNVDSKFKQNNNSCHCHSVIEVAEDVFRTFSLPALVFQSPHNTPIGLLPFFPNQGLQLFRVCSKLQGFKNSEFSFCYGSSFSDISFFFSFWYCIS